MNWVLIYITNCIDPIANKPTSLIACKTNVHKTLEESCALLQKNL